MTDDVFDPFSLPRPDAASGGVYDPFTASAAALPRPKPPNPNANNSTFGDLMRSAEGAAITGTGQTIAGLGNVVTKAARGIDSALGTNIAPATPLGADTGAAVEKYGEDVASNVSPEFAEATSKGLTDDGGLSVTNVANKALNTVAGLAPQIVGTGAAALVNPAAGVATGAALFGGQGGQAAKEEEQARIAGLSDTDIAQVPRYNELVQSGLSPADARAQLSTEAGEHAFNVGGGVGAALGVLPAGKAVEAGGKVAADALARFLPRPLSNVAGRAAAEGGTFAGINAAGQVVQNATNEVPTDTTAGVGEAAASGLLPGAVMGGLHTLLHRPVPFPRAEPGSLSDAANAVAEGAHNDIRSESAVAEADDAQTPRDVPAAPGSLADAAQSVEPTPPPPVPWINAQTGELRTPSDNEVKDQFHQMFQFASEGGAGAGATAASKFLAGEWGIPLQRLRQLRSQAIAERHTGFRPGMDRPDEVPDTLSQMAADQAAGVGADASASTPEAAPVQGELAATTPAATPDDAQPTQNTAAPAPNTEQDRGQAEAPAPAATEAAGATSSSENITNSAPASTDLLRTFNQRAEKIDDLNAQRKAGTLTLDQSNQLHDLRDQQDLVNPVSGLPNRKAYNEWLASGDYSHRVLIDVDGFKKINDTLGHGVGDLVLQHIGQELNDASNDNVKFGHLSGDEYAAVSKGDPTDQLSKQQDQLANTPFTINYVDANGKQVEHTFKGIGVTFGVGKSLHEADLATNASKQDRKQRGLRVDREDTRPDDNAGGLPAAEGSDAALGPDGQKADLGPSGQTPPAGDAAREPDAGTGGKPEAVSDADVDQKAAAKPQVRGEVSGVQRNGAAADAADENNGGGTSSGGGGKTAGVGSVSGRDSRPANVRGDNGNAAGAGRAGIPVSESGNDSKPSTVKTSVGDISVDRSHDVGLLGSSGKSGKVYIDKDWQSKATDPAFKTAKHPSAELDREPMLVEHEAVEADAEKRGVDYSKAHYDHAEPAEHKTLLETLGLKAGTRAADRAIEAYEKSYKQDLIKAGQKKETNPPPDLIEKPYEHPHNVEQRKLLAEVEKAPGNATPLAKEETAPKKATTPRGKRRAKKLAAKPEDATDATDQEQEQEGVQPKRENGDGGGQATEAGGGDRVQRGGGEKETKPSAEPEKTAPVADAASIAKAHEANHAAQYPDRPDVGKKISGQVGEAIASKSANGLIGLNIGDRANVAIRKTFQDAAGIKLPKGRAASESAVRKWASLEGHIESAPSKDTALDKSFANRRGGNTKLSGDRGNTRTARVENDRSGNVPPSGSRDSVGGAKASTKERASDAAGANAKRVSDGLKGSSAVSHGVGGVEVPARRPDHQVSSDVRTLGHDSQVGKDVVKSVPVNVVDDLASGKRSAQRGLHDQPMLKSLPTDSVDHNANEAIRSSVSGKDADVAGRSHRSDSEKKPNITSNSSGAERAKVMAAAAHHNEINDAVKETTSKWGDNQPNVRVVDSPEKLPAAAKANDRYETARGYYDGKGTAYLVSSNLKDVPAALRTLAHEAIGHHGVENILNDHVKGGWDRLSSDIDAMRQSGGGSDAMKSVLDDVAKRYPDADKTTFAKETLAVMAERGVRNSLMGRVVAAVRAFLRTVMPDLKYNDADLRGLLGKSDDFINAKENYADRVDRIQAAAFDRTDTAGVSDAANTKDELANAAKAWKEKGTDSPYFQKWFGSSKVVDEDGKPQVVYHGTGSDFDIFDQKRAGQSGEHATAPLGHFFTEDRALADRYADRASADVPADKRVVDSYLSLKKPFEMSLEDAQKIETPKQATALREKLEKQGFDGIRIPEAKSWVAFDPESIKSATDNRGTFDAKNKSILFDRPAEDEEPGENFDKPRSSVDALGKVLAQPDGGVLDRVKQWVGGKIDDIKPTLLGALQLRHVLEMMEGYEPLKGASQYKELEQTMTADRIKLMIGDPDQAKEEPKNMIAKGAANIASDWRKYAYEKGPAGWLGRERPQARELSDLMHGATRFGLDPSEEYKRLSMADSKDELHEWTKDGIKQRIKELRGQMRGRPGDDKSLMMDEVKRLRNLPKREELRKERWPDLVAKWQGLSDEGKEIYRNVRDWYAQNSNETEKALLQRIDALDVPESYKQSISDRIRFQFESNRREGVYFPLQRFGDYWMSLKDSKGENAFLMFEGSKEYANAEKKLRAGGYNILAHGRKDLNYKAKDAPTGTFVADIIKQLQKAGAPEKVQDDIYQSYLKTLPEMSMRRHSIHRQNVAGYSDNALRVYAKNSFHSAHQLARLRYGYQMQGVVDAMQMHLDNYRSPSDLETRNQTDPKVVARADTLLGELKRRHDWIMSPKDTQLANVANSIGFMYYLGASPSSALVFLTQNAQMTLPALGAKHGWGKAAPALMSAMKDAIRTGGNIDRTLTNDEERRAFQVFKQRGDITRTQAHALAGLSEGNQLQSTPAWSAVMNGMSFFMHKADMINRGAAGVAAFRLARRAGESFDDAVKYGSDIINGTHGDYSNANRARYMQGSAQKVLFQFKSYALMMAWNTYRNLHQSFKAETPEARKLARRTFTGMMGMAGLLSGTMGLPFYSLARMVGNSYHTAMGDPNEPWDFDTEFKGWLNDHLGPEAGNMVATGAANKLGADIGDRVKLSDEWFREPDKELEGNDAYYNLLDSLAGPMGGMAKNWFVGKKMLDDGNTERAFETWMPKPVRDSMKALRYAREGDNTLKGDPIVPDVTTPEMLIQALGFQPTRLAEQSAENRALKNYSQQIQDKRQQLVNAFAIALGTGDDDLRSGVLERMQQFNATNPEIAISAANLRSNLLSRRKASAETENGVRLNKKVNEAVRQAVGTHDGAQA